MQVAVLTIILVAAAGTLAGASPAQPAYNDPDSVSATPKLPPRPAAAAPT